MDFIKTHKQIILYLIFGVATTAVNWIVYAIAMWLLPIKNTEFKVLIGGMIAWVLAVLFAYVVNKRFVFESNVTDIYALAKECLAFFGARCVTGLIEVLGLPVLVWIGLNQMLFGVDGFIAKAIISVVVVVLNYVFSKRFVFR